MRHLVTLGELIPSDRLAQAKDALLINYRAARDVLIRLRKSDVDEWEHCRIELEEAWERLNRSVSAFSAKFEDERRLAAGTVPSQNPGENPTRGKGDNI